MARRLRPVALLLASAVAACGAAVACSKAPDVNAPDTSSEGRLLELERTVRELKSENDAAKQALGASGNERMSVASRVAELVDKVRRLEEQVAAGTAVASSSAPKTGTDAPGATSTPLPVGAPVVLAPAADGTFTPEVVTTLDLAMKAVEQKRREEQEKKQLHDVLERNNLSLSPEQEALVLKLQRDYTSKRQQLFDSMGLNRRGGAMQSEAARDEMRAKLEEIQTQHENDLRAQLPSSVAEAVVTAMKSSYPGFFPRDRSGMRGPGGMSGN